MVKISLLIHGPYDNNCIDKIYKNYVKVSSEVEETIIVSYTKDEALYKKILELYPDWNVRLITIKDTLNPGFFNINRQILSVRAGLANIRDDNFVIKLRNDQFVNFKKLFKILKNKDFFSSSRYKIITTNCYTRRDRLYHPSDMFLCGWNSFLSQYYAAPLDSNTALEHMMMLQEEDEAVIGKYHSLRLTPESYLFRSYISKHGWIIKENKKDSLNALRYFTYVINSWNIDYCWTKDRTPYSGTNALILPCYFTIRPFRGVKKEKARCWSASKINQERKSLKDVYYLLKSRLLFHLKYTLRL